MNAHKIKTFKDLEAWKAGHKLVLMIYRVTKAFPRDELFGLINQLRRAAVISKDVGYIERKDYTAINEQSESVHRLIRGMLRYIKAKNIVFMAVLILALILNTNYQIPNTKYQILNTTYAASSTFTESLATTGVSGNPPSVPTNLVATPVSDKEIDLSWTASQSGGLYAISGYRIFRGVDYAGTTTVATTTSTAYADTGLTASTTYTYTVEAFDANQQYSGQSAGAATTTLQVPPTPVSTATPTPVSSGGSSGIGSGAQLSISSLDIVPSQNAAEVAFDTSMPAQAKVMWGTTADYEAGSVMSIAYGTSHDLELTGLLPGTEYFVEVQAVNYLGTVASLTTSFVTAPVPPSSPEAIGPLPNPTRFAATAEQSDIALSWQNPSDPRFAKVRVVRSEAFFPKDQNDGTPVYEGSAQSFVDTGVETGKTYYYAIFAEGADGQFSSGALAQARISAAGQLSLPFDPFAALPQAQSTDPLIKALSLSDFQFIQDGKVLSTVNGHTVAVNGSENLTIRLSYDMVPEVLKTIAFTLTDPSDPSKVFPFLLRVNKDKTYYEATIAPLGRSGEYGLQIVVLDYQDQSLKRINGNIMAIAFQALPHVAKVGFDDAGVGFLFLLILAILGLIAAARSMKRRRRLAASTVIYIVSGLAFAAAALSVIGFAASAARAASYNPEINYQGKLTNASNVAVADGSYNMEFKIYNTLTGATTSALWTEDDLVSNGQGVKVTNGLFSVMLGSTTPFGNNIDWNQPLYLGVNIGGTGSSPSWDSEMSPRKIIGTVPAAFFAATSSTSTVALNAQALNSLGSSEFLRSDAQNATSTSSTFLSFLQSGAGKVAEFFGQAAESVLSLLSNGNVGIGTSTPSAKLAVSANNGETNTQLFTVASSTANSTTTLFTVLNNGNVGIGTSSPYATLSVSGPIAVSGAASANSLTINGLSGVSVRCLEVNPDGSVAANASACGSGSGSGGGTWATTTSSVANELINYSLNSTDIIAIGGTATTTAEYWFDPNAAQASFAGRLSVPYASTTAITVSGTKGLTLSNLNGPLQAVNGAVSASSTISVAYGGTGLSTSPTYGQILVGNSSGGYALTATSSLGLPQGTVTSVNASGGTTGLSFSGGPITTSGTLTLAGTLNVANGGTGWGNIQSGALLYGNGTGALSTTSAGTAGQVLALLNGVPTWAATTTFGTGLTYTNGNVTNAGVLSISQTSGTAQTGAITLGTSSQTTNGQTIGLAITNTGGAFTLTPTISGTLNNTGLTNSAVTVNAGSGLLGGGQVSLGSSVTLSAQIATSAVPTVGGLAYWTGRGTPSTLGTIATGTVTCSGGVSCGSGSYVVGSNLSLSSFSYPFALATDFGTANQATTGIVWFQNGLNASSTSVLQNASTSELTVSGQLYDKNRSAGNAGYVLMSTANGTQWVATTSIANGVTSISQTSGTAQTGAITLGTSSQTTNGLTTGINITNTGGSFVLTPTLSGILSVSGGGTGTSTAPALNQLLIGNGAGGYNYVATSSLGLANGTVTSIATNNGLTGGTITSSGTIGLNTANLAANILTYWDGSNLHATSSPTVGYIIATSTTASQFPYASTTAITATTASTTNLIVSGLGGVSTRCLQVGPDGTVSANSAACGTGSGSGNATWSTTTSSVSGELVNYSNNNSDIVAIGGTATTTAKYWFDPNALVASFSGKVGIGTTSPYAALSVVGSTGIVADHYSATNTNATSTFAGNVAISGSPTVYASNNSLSLGVTSDSLSSVLASGSGSLAMGYGLTLTQGGSVQATGTASFAGGVSVGNSSSPGLIGAGGGGGSLAYGYATNGGTIGSWGSGSISLGAVSTGKIISNNSGSVALGYSTGGSMISSGLGSFVGGYQLGNSHDIVSSGNGSFAFGNNMTASGNYSTAFGSGFTNNVANSFMIGYSSTPTLTVNSTNVGIGTTSPYANLSVNALNGSANTTLFAVASSTANSTTTLFAIGNTGIITSNASATSTFAAAIKAPCFTTDGTTCLGGGTGSGTVNTGTQGQIAFYNSNTNAVTGTSSLFIAQNGNVGIGGTTTPWTTLSVTGASDLGNFALAGYFNATNTNATSTFAGGLTIGNNGLVYDSYSGVTTISSLQTGAMRFDTDAGVISWTDLPIDSSAPNGTTESYSANLNGSPMLTIYGQADGAGNIINPGVGIGTTSPFTTFAVQGNSYFSGSLTAGNVTATGTASTTNLIVSNSATIGTLSGLLYGTNGSVGTIATSSFNLSIPLASTTGILAVNQGGTGTSSAPALNQLLIGNGAGGYNYVATSSLGLANGTVTSIATNNGLTGGTITSSGTIGLNTANLAANILTYWDGSNLHATSSPTVGYITATSSTATSTFAGNVAIGTGDVFANNTSLALGTVNSGAQISAISKFGGNIAGGYAFKGATAGIISATGTGAIAFGAAQGATNPATLGSGGQASMAFGEAYNGGNLYSTGIGSFGFGYANTGNILSSGNGSFAGGLADNSSRNVIASGYGSFAMGYAHNGSVLASNNGSFAAGYANTGNITSSGIDSFAFGDNLTASGDYSTAFGTGFTNSQANSFMVGYNSVPSLTVNGTGVGIGTTSPWAQLSIAGTSTPAFPLFAISTSTANSTSTAFIVDKNGWVGIGTTTPGSILAVQGIGNFTTGTSTFTSAGGINLTKGCYAIGGNCLPTTSSVYSSIASAYPFQLAGNATSTLTQFNGGLTSYASTTIGNGTATGGLTVSGNATTTGDAYFVSHVGIGTAITSSSNAQLDVKTTNNTAVHITTPDQSLMGVVINNATYSTNQLSGFGLYQSDTGFGTLLDNNSSGISLAPSGGVSIGSTYGNTDAGANNLIVSGNVGVGTSSPWRTLSVNGSSDLGTNALAGSFTATSTTASIFPYASTTALTVSGTKGLTIGSLNGPLQAVNGAVSASSTISVAYGGTGLSTSPTYGQILVGNSSGGYALTATSSLGLPNGTVTSIATNNGLTGGTITSSGTIGLNTANLAANILTYWDGSNLHATSSPTVGYLVATSSTATSTFAGGLSVAGTNGFTVLQNGNVGISTASPNYNLEVSGTASTTNLYATNLWGSYANLGTTTALSYGSPLAVNDLASSQASLGAETVTDGTFATDPTGIWTLGSGWTWNSVSSRADYAGAGGPISTIAINNGGTGYTTGDTVTISGGTGDATYTVTASGGVVTALTKVSGGTTYTTTSSANTTGGTGTGLNVSITQIADASALSQTITTTSGSYQVLFTIANYTGSGKVKVMLGGSSAGYYSGNGTYSVILANGSSISFTPTGDFNGGITNVSVMKLAGTSALVRLNNFDGTAANEFRSGGTNLYNTFSGLGAGQFTYHTTGSTGEFNTANGYNALYSNTTGYSNTANGNSALYSNTTGSYNTANGNYALYYNTTGYSNTANGYNALYSNTTGYSNTANGNSALYSNTTGSYNTANGNYALYYNTTGYSNTANGYYALRSNTTGYSNTANGMYALYSNTTGGSNTANGNYALYSNTTGGSNTANGYYALYNNTSATNTVAVGFQAARGTSSYSNQGGTYLGYQSGYSAATGSNYNTLLGYQSGYDLSTGSYNIAIGQNVDLASSTASQQLNIGNLIYGTGLYSGSSMSSAPVSGGMVGIGTTSPYAQLSIQAVNGSTNGTLFAIGSSTASATMTIFSVSNTGSTTIANGINIASGCYAVGGNCLNVGSGLTGSGSANLMTYWTGSGSLAATGSPTVGYITATSSTATSSIAGNIAVGSTGVIASIPSSAQLQGGAVAIGSVWNSSGSGGVASEAAGSLALGSIVDQFSGVGSIASQAAGSFAGGNVAATTHPGSIISSGSGSLAWGQIQSISATSSITASSNGSIALGEANGGNITSSGSGSFAGGNSTSGSITASGDGSFAFGNNVSATGTLSTAFGTGFSNTSNNSFMVGYSSTPTLTVNSTSVGIGTTSPWTTLSVTGASDLGNFALAGYFNATNTSATSTFAGGLTVGNNGLVYDSNSGVTTISSLTTGNMSFETDAGAVNWVDLPIDSTPSNGTVERYSASLNGTPMLTIFGQADGAGNIINNAVGIGSTSPNWFFSVAGTGSFDNYVRASYFTATSSIASIFPYASTTAITATTASTTNLIVSNASTLGFASSTALTVSGTASTTNLVISSAGGTGTRCLQVGPDGTVSANAAACGAGAGSAAGTWSTTTSSVSGELVNYSNNNTDVVAIGNTSTTTAPFWFDPNALVASLSGKVGIGTTSPFATLSVNGSGFFGGSVTADSFNATDTSATSTLAGGLTVGTNGLVYDSYSGITTISALQTGGMSFPTDAGALTWTDLPIDSTPANGTVESYSADLNGNPMLTIFGQADGAGNIINNSVGIGTTSPFGFLSASASTTYPAFVVAQATSTNAGPLAAFYAGTNEVARISNAGYLGLGTTSPWTTLSVNGFSDLGYGAQAGYFNATNTSATSTFAGGLNVGNGAITYDWNSGTTSIPYLETGNMNFAADSGNVSWIDMPVTSASANGVENSYTANLNGNALLTVAGISNGSGGLSSMGVGVGTTSPSGFFAVSATSSTPALFVTQSQSSTANGLLAQFFGGSTEELRLTSAGLLGLSTTSPWRTLSVNGSSDLGTNALAGSFTATSSVASTFPYASSTALTVSGEGYFGTASTTNLIISSAGGSGTRCLQVGPDGTVSANSAACGGSSGSSGGTWSTTTSSVSGELVNYSNNNTDVVAIGNTSTTTAKYWFDPNALIASLSGKVGIGTTSPWTTLSVNGSSDLGNFAMAGYFNATNTSATSTLAGGLTVGTNGLVYDSYSGVTTISSLTTGNMNFETDAGAVTWTDLPIDSTPPNGTVESYSASLNGTPMLTIFGQADGAGNIINNAVGIGTTSPFGFLSASASTTYPAFVVAQATSTNAGPLAAFYAGTNEVARFSNAGYLGLGTTSPWTTLSVNGSSDLGNFAMAGYFNATNTSATSTFAGSVNIGNGSFVYDNTGGTTTISNLQLGNLSFDTDAGVVSAMDMPVDSSAAAGTPEAYNFNLNSSPVLTVYSQATGSGGVQNTAVGIGTTSPYALLSVAGQSEADYFYAASTTATSTFAGGLQANLLKVTSTTGTSTFAGFIDVNGTGTNATSTFASNLWVKGALKVGTASLYMTANGIFSTDGSIAISNPEMTGIATSTFQQLGTQVLNVSTTTATSTFANGINLSGGCFAVNGACVSGGSASLSGGTAGMLASWVSGSSLTATSGPTAAYYTATSTATSTFTGGLQVNLLNVTSTTATSTFANGINLTNGCFSVNGTCVGGDSGSGTVNSGTQGQIAFYNANGTAVSGTSSISITQSQLVGIGTTSPSMSKLSVDSGSNQTGFLVTGSVNNYLQSVLWNRNSGGTGSTDYILTNDLGSPGSTSYYADLGLNSSKNADSSYPITWANDAYLYNQDGGLILASATSTSNGRIVFATGGFATSSIRMTISNTGNVGIGTTSPWTTLSVNGFSDLGYGAQAGYFNATNTNATSTLAGALQVGSATSPADAGMQFGLDPFAWTIGYKASDNSFRISSSTALGSNDIFTLAKGGNFTLNSTGATSTINGNLYVNGTLRGTDVYSGDLIFANGFRYTEAPLGTTTSQGLLLRNQNSQDVLSIDEKGNLSVAGDVCYAGKQCFGKSLNSLADYVSSLASSTAESLFSSQATTTASLADLTASVGSLQTELGAIHAQVDSLSSTTADSSILAAEAVSALTGSSTALDLIASSTASSTASMLASSTSFIQAVTGAVQAAIQSAGNWIVDKLTAHVVYTDRVEAKVAAISEGIEMTDQVTGQIYCVVMRNGSLAQTAGPCSTATTTPITTASASATTTTQTTTTTTASAAQTAAADSSSSATATGSTSTASTTSPVSTASIPTAGSTAGTTSSSSQTATSTSVSTADATSTASSLTSTSTTSTTASATAATASTTSATTPTTATTVPAASTATPSTADTSTSQTTPTATTASATDSTATSATPPTTTTNTASTVSPSSTTNTTVSSTNTASPTTTTDTSASTASTPTATAPAPAPTTATTAAAPTTSGTSGPAPSADASSGTTSGTSSTTP